MLQLRLFTKTCQVFVSIFFVALPRIPSYAMAFLPLRRPFVAWIMEWNCFNEIPLGDWNKIQFDLFGEKQVEGFALVSRQLGSECLQRFVNDVKRSGNREIKKYLTSLTQQSHLGLMLSCIFTTRKKNRQFEETREEKENLKCKSFIYKKIYVSERWYHGWFRESSVLAGDLVTHKLSEILNRL